SEPEFMDLRRDARAFASIAGYGSTVVTITGGAEPDRVPGARVTDGFFATLGTAPARGRAFTAEEERRGGAPVVIVSDALWRRYLGGTNDAVGRVLQIGGRAYTI